MRLELGEAEYRQRLLYRRLRPARSLSPPLLGRDLIQTFVVESLDEAAGEDDDEDEDERHHHDEHDQHPHLEEELASLAHVPRVDGALTAASGGLVPVVVMAPALVDAIATLARRRTQTLHSRPCFRANHVSTLFTSHLLA